MTDLLTELKERRRKYLEDLDSLQKKQIEEERRTVLAALRERPLDWVEFVHNANAMWFKEQGLEVREADRIFLLRSVRIPQ